jgi:hypothetical protein
VVFRPTPGYCTPGDSHQIPWPTSTQLVTRLPGASGMWQSDATRSCYRVSPVASPSALALASMLTFKHVRSTLTLRISFRGSGEVCNICYVQRHVPQHCSELQCKRYRGSETTAPASKLVGELAASRWAPGGPARRPSACKRRVSRIGLIDSTDLQPECTPCYGLGLLAAQTRMRTCGLAEAKRARKKERKQKIQPTY